MYEEDIETNLEEEMTDSEIATDRIIHPEKYAIEEDDDDDEIETDETGIFYCDNCSTIIDGSTISKRDSELEKYNKSRKKTSDKIRFFKDMTICPNCGRKLRKINKKQMEKYKLKNRLKKLAEEEEKAEAEQKAIAIEVMGYIIAETMDVLSVLEYGLEVGKLNAKIFADKFYEQACRMLTIRKKEYMPSNHFIKEFRDSIVDYNREIIEDFGDLEPEMIEKDSIAFKRGEEEYARNKEAKGKLKEFKKNEKDARKRLDNDFTKMLKQEVK